MRRHLSVVGVLGVAVLAVVYGALGVPLTLGSTGPADTGSLADTPERADSTAGSNATTTTANPTTTTSTDTETTTTAATATSSSGSTSKSGPPAEHYVVVAGGSSSNVVDYQLTATGEVTPAEGRSDWPVSADSVSFDPEDSVDGRTASGTLGGGADAFWYDGGLTCFQVSDPDAVTVYVDGEAVAADSVAGGTQCDSSSGDGSDASDGGESDSSSDGDSSGTSGDSDAGTSDEVNVSFPSCTEVRVDGLEDSGWEVEHVSLRVWLLDDWTRNGPPPIDTHMIGLPQNDTGPVYTYANDSLVRGDLYIVGGVTLVSPDGEHVEWSNPHDCEFVVGVSDNGTVSQPRDGS